MSAARCHTRGSARIRWAPRPDGLEESVQFQPGYNCPDMSMQGHGVHGMEITWLLRGPAGAVQAALGTDWIPGKLWPGHGISPDGTRGWQRNSSGLWSTDPWGRGLGWHSRLPRYSDHLGEECGLIGGPCFYDERLTGADSLVEPFMRDGEQVMWDALETAYMELSQVISEAG